MSDPIARFYGARAVAMRSGNDDELPDAFQGMTPLVNEIGTAVINARGQANQLLAECLHRDLDAMAATTEALERFADQSRIMTASLRKVIEFHRARRANGRSAP